MLLLFLVCESVGVLPIITGRIRSTQPVFAPHNRFAAGIAIIRYTKIHPHDVSLADTIGRPSHRAAPKQRTRLPPAAMSNRAATAPHLRRPTYPNA